MKTLCILLILVVLVGCQMRKTTPSAGPATPEGLRPGEMSQPDLPATTRPEPVDEPLIVPFTPAYPCELQNDSASVSDGESCRSERIQEVIIAEGDGVAFVHRTSQRGYGCWSSINAYSYELLACNRSSGERVTLAEDQTTPPLASPDGAWFAFGVIDIEELEPHVYRVGSDGRGLQQLDSQGLPEWAVGVRLTGWSADGEWLTLSLWDGRTDGWHGYQLATDSGGLYEALSPAAATPSMTVVAPPTDAAPEPTEAAGMSDLAAAKETAAPIPLPSPTSTPGAETCTHAWFFAFPVAYPGHCPLPVIVSPAAMQPFERGTMIWLEEPGRYFILTQEILYVGQPRRAYAVINDPLDITGDSSAEFPPPAGLFAPAHGFGLVWRGDVGQSAGFQERLGWATAAEYGYQAKYQCEPPTVSGGRSWQFCFLQAPDGQVIVLHALEGWLWLSEWRAIAATPAAAAPALETEIVGNQSGR